MPGAREGKKICCHSWHISFVLGTPWNISHIVYNSASAFTSCLYRAWRSAISETYGLLWPSLFRHSALGMCMAFSIPWNIWELSKSVISTHSSFHNLFLPICFGLLLVPIAASCHNLLQPIPVPLIAFGKYYLRSCPSCENTLSHVKQRQAFVPVLQRAAR